MEIHYADIKKLIPDLWESFMTFVTSSPVVAMVWEGTDIIKTGRKIIGATKPVDHAMGTIRGNNSVGLPKNIVHASDCVEAANKEIAHWFKESELIPWNHNADTWVSGVN